MQFSRHLARLIDRFYVQPFCAMMSRQVFRYIACGGINFVVTIICYAVAYNFIFAKQNLDLWFVVVSPHVAAIGISIPVNFLVGFWLQRNISFSRSSLRDGVQFFRYLSTTLAGMLINYPLTKLFVDILLIFVLSIIFPAYTFGQSFLVRTNASVGYSNSKELSGLSYSYGVKVGLDANDKQRYGLMFDRLVLAENTDNRTMYYTTGIFLEQVLWKYFNMGIGTVGYINRTEKGKNTFGIYSHLGFEYPFAKRWHFLASCQNNFIFTEKTISNSALSLGVGMKF